MVIHVDGEVFGIPKTMRRAEVLMQRGGRIVVEYCGDAKLVRAITPSEIKAVEITESTTVGSVDLKL